MGIDYYMKDPITSNTVIFWLVYSCAGLFLIFASIMVVLYLQDPFCAIGVDTINECLLTAFETFKAHFNKLFKGL